ncbi:hypothetical protein MTR_0047s0050 [Medicago truncatula]|uniref:Uncharacterized protein n=1 Tax=Medicago truncatula TaxID=3880 RepID=A0A072TU34_MEDTR|nr:hypothetical protein MTR_0047s0050 [Medicago truncatula]
MSGSRQLLEEPNHIEGRGVVAGAPGTTMSGSRQLLEEPNDIRMRGILRPCRMYLLFGSSIHKNSTVKRA